MNKRKFGKKDLIEILIKKASGFYYYEEIYEYEKTQNKSKNAEKQLSFFENTQIFNINDRDKTILPYTNDTINLSNEKASKSKQEYYELALSKKKVTSHFIPPDMLAIKILFEIFGEKIGEDNFEKMTNEELIKLKNKLIEELKNESN